MDLFIYGLLNDDVRGSHYTVLNDSELKGCERKQVPPNVRYYPACGVTEKNNKPVIIARYKVEI